MMNKEVDTKKTSWSDLPTDIQVTILSNIYVPEDAFRVGMTCKSFRESYETFRATNHWLGIPTDRQVMIGVAILTNTDLPPEDVIRLSSTCKSLRESYKRCRAFSREIASPMSPHLMFALDQLYEPNHNKLYCLEDVETVVDSNLQDSNYGWLLMTKWREWIFFYNPSNSEVIDLPELPQPEDHHFIVWHFTAPPTHDKCRVICVEQSCIKTITICLIECGQEEWQVHQHVFANRTSYFLDQCSHPVMLKGVLYCLGVHGDLMAFDSESKTFSFTSCRKDMRRKLQVMRADSYLVESDGNLLCVFLYRDGSWVGVYRLNTRNMMLERIYTLGNKVLYLSRHGCFSEKATFGNKIFIPMSYGGFCLYYSLETRKFHTINGYRTHNFNDGPECYEGSAVWIKPISHVPPNALRDTRTSMSI